MRNDFRAWLIENAETSEGVWLVFGKTKAVVSLSANDALEEALCFGWIDGQMQSIDSTKYNKYFSKHRAKSVWSEGRYLSFKTEEARRRDFEKTVDRLNNNLKPM